NTVHGWITSTYYGNALPGWVESFNAKKLPDNYLKQNWNTLYPIGTYAQSGPDAQRWEGILPGGGNTFPHITDTLKGDVAMNAFRTSPWGNAYTLEFAKSAVINERLGKSGATDFLTVSLSSPDYIGHTFGPNSIEAEDGFLRLDQQLASFLQFLDQNVGKGKYLLFLTADHGAAHTPGFAADHKIPSGRVDDRALQDSLNATVSRMLGVPRAVRSLINYQVYLDNEAIRKAGADRNAVKNIVMSELMRHPGVSKVADLENLTGATLPPRIKDMVMNGYNQQRSGDIQFLFKPQWFDWGGNTGTTHGAPYPYDAHIPLVFFGWKQKPGRLVREVYMTDIAATVAALLHIQMPNACVGKPIEEVVK
ncbi:MAG: alkaline phosphatase family protein, partial [Sphingobacteriales bacterium]